MIYFVFYLSRRSSSLVRCAWRNRPRERGAVMESDNSPDSVFKDRRTAALDRWIRVLMHFIGL